MAYLNVYRSGYYHRKGKPGQYNCHPGDLYPTYEAARRDIDPAAAHLYLGTFEANVPASVLGDCNPINSVPTPLSESRRILRIPSQVEGMRSIETSEAEANGDVMEQQLRDLRAQARYGTGEEGR